MKLADYSREELKGKSLIEVAKLVLDEEKKAMHFKDLFAKLAEIRELTEEQKKQKVVQFYTDLNIEGRFITLGSNMWGLKRWYPVEKIDEEITAAPKKKKAKVTKKKTANPPAEDEGLDVVDEDMEKVVDGFEEEELEDGEFDDVLDEEIEDELGDEDFSEDDDEEYEDEEEEEKEEK